MVLPVACAEVWSVAHDPHVLAFATSYVPSGRPLLFLDCCWATIFVFCVEQEMLETVWARPRSYEVTSSDQMCRETYSCS